MSDDVKILLLDLELSYAIYYAYPSKREQYLSADNIIYDQFCSCAAWKWHDQKQVHAVKLTDFQKQFKKNFRDDVFIAKALHELMTEADIIVAHNGDAFDIKHANCLFIKHGLGPIPENKSIDTLKVARKYFNFPGNSLDQLSKRFGSTGKNKKPDWKKMTCGDAKEINQAAVYCKNDVLELEKIFVKLRPYIKNYPVLNRPKGVPTRCRKCGGTHITESGYAYTKTGRTKRYKCNSCGTWKP